MNSNKREIQHHLYGAEVLADVVSLKKYNNYRFTGKTTSLVAKILSDQKLD